MTDPKEVLEDLGYEKEHKSDPGPQWAIFLEAYRIYQERQQEHGDKVWQASGWRGMLVDMRKKLDRLWFRYWDQDNTFTPVDDFKSGLDSAYDLLNYTAFFIRQVESGSRDGGWPWPEDK